MESTPADAPYLLIGQTDASQDVGILTQTKIVTVDGRDYLEGLFPSDKRWGARSGKRVFVPMASVAMIVHLNSWDEVEEIIAEWNQQTGGLSKILSSFLKR